MKRVVAFDIDNTTYDFTASVERAVHKETGDLAFRMDKQHYSIARSCGQYASEVRGMVNKNREFMVNPEMYIEEAVETINYIKYVLGYNIAVVTARGTKGDAFVKDCEWYEKATRDSLYQAKIPFDEFHFGTEDKASLARERGYFAFVEDAPHQIKSLHGELTTIIIPHDYNADLGVGIRVASQYQIPNVLLKDNARSYESGIRDYTRYCLNSADYRNEGIKDA